MQFNKRGQVTIFVILGIIIVATVAGYFLYKDVLKKEVIPESIQPIETTFLACLERDILTGVSILESSGGYIEQPTFSPGSRYMPFSSKLNFAGVEIPYWFYVSGSNVAKNQVPTKQDMEDELAKFIETKIKSCNLIDYRDAGYKINLNSGNADVVIEDDYIDVTLNSKLSVQKGVDGSVINEHKIRINSKLGLLYNEAVSIYEKEQADFFLENYSLDVLRLYAPVDGVELTCSPLTWNAEKIYTDLKQALEANTDALKNKGEGDDYFVVDVASDAVVNFIYSSDWPTYLEINPTEGNMLISKPIGNQQGLGILGFCYVPYHFVYNFRHPVLVQVSDSGETFQFPIVVLIEGNLPRTALSGTSVAGEESDVCEYKNNLMKINLYDSNLNAVDGQISFECFGARCDIGSTEKGVLNTNFPQCANGIIRVTSPGFKDSKTIYSTINSGNLVILLEKEYEKEISLVIGGKKYSDPALLTFSGENTLSITYPEINKVNLSAGEYNFSVYLYENSSITLPQSEKEQCYTVPRSGLLGVAGLTKKECTTVTISEQVVTNAISGGGSGKIYFSEDDLRKENILEITGEGLNTPTSLDELQKNYLLVDTNVMGAKLK